MVTDTDLEIGGTGYSVFLLLPGTPWMGMSYWVNSEIREQFIFLLL